MTKELESLEFICKILNEKRIDIKWLFKNEYNTVEQALKRLEAIDNAKPNEALECLEKLKGMEISSMPFSDEYGTQEVDLNDIRKVGSQLNTDFREYTDTIEQALIKAQEQDFNYKNIVIPFFDELANVLGTNDIDEMLDKIKEQEKVLEIIKNKKVKIDLLYASSGVEQYNDELVRVYGMWFVKDRQLTQDEFDTLKRCFEQ